MSIACINAYERLYVRVQEEGKNHLSSKRALNACTVVISHLQCYLLKYEYGDEGVRSGYQDNTWNETS